MRKPLLSIIRLAMIVNLLLKLTKDTVQKVLVNKLLLLYFSN